MKGIRRDGRVYMRHSDGQLSRLCATPGHVYTRRTASSENTRLVIQALQHPQSVSQSRSPLGDSLGSGFQVDGRCHLRVVRSPQCSSYSFEGGVGVIDVPVCGDDRPIQAPRDATLGLGLECGTGSRGLHQKAGQVSGGGPGNRSGENFTVQKVPHPALELLCQKNVSHSQNIGCSHPSARPEWQLT